MSMSVKGFRVPRAAGAAVAAVLLAASCTDDTGPGRPTFGSFGVAPVFSAAAGIVPVTAGRFVLRRTTDAQLVMDTVIAFGVQTDSVDLTLTVALDQPGETFELTIALVGTAGDTVFRAGPLTVTPIAGSGTPPVIPVPVVYTGVGADAASVLIVVPETSLFFNQQLTLQAAVLDSAGQPIPNAPVEWRSLDSTRVRVARPDSGRVIAQPLRGPARIVARLLTDQADTVQLVSQPTPSTIVVSAGNNQSAPPGAALELPLVAQVLAADAGGVAGVWVRFEVIAGGGTLASGTAVDSVLTTAQGLAQAALTLGQAGPQVVEATTSLLPNASAIFTAALAVGAQVSWVSPAGGTWSTGANWSTGVPPGPLDTAVIALAGTYTVTLDVSPTVAGLTLGGTSGAQSLDVTGPLQTLTVTSDGVIGPSGRLDLVSGDLILAGGSALTLSGGTLRVGPGRALVVGFGDATAITYAGGSIGGPGVLFLNQGARLTLQAALGLDSLVLEVNDATVDDGGAGRLFLQPTAAMLLNSQTGTTVNVPVENAGVLSAIGTGVTLNDSLYNISGATLQVNASPSAGEFTVGAIDNAGTVFLLGEVPATLTILGNGEFTNRPSGTLTVPFGSHVLNAMLVNLGTVTVVGGLTVNHATAQHQNSGLITVAAGQRLTITGGTFTNVAAGNFPPGVISGEGILDVTGTAFSNAGSVAPGFSPGVLSLAGNYGGTRTGLLDIELGGSTAGTEYDRLQVSGVAALGGVLNITLINGFTPSAADSFGILSFGSATDRFSTIASLDLGGGLFLDTLWSPTDLALVGRRVISTPGNPVDLAVSSGTGRVYALVGLPTGGAASVVAVDGTTHEPVDTAFIDAVTPFALAVNPVTEKLYISDFQGVVFVVDGQSGTSLNAIGLQAGFATVDEAKNLVYLPATLSVNVCAPPQVCLVDVPGLVKLDGAADTVFTADTVQLGGVGQQVFGSAFNPNDGLVYVALNEDPGFVLVVDPGARSVVDSIPVASSPFAVALNPATNRLYVTSDRDNSVTAVDLTTRTVIGSVAIGGYTPNVAVDVDLDRIYAPNYDASTVTIIDGATNTVLKVIPAGAATDGAYDAVPGPVGAALFIGRYNAGEITITRR
jgi:YVTN family beta-propeller protein